FALLARVAVPAVTRVLVGAGPRDLQLHPDDAHADGIQEIAVDRLLFGDGQVDPVAVLGIVVGTKWYPLVVIAADQVRGWRYIVLVRRSHSVIARPDGEGVRRQLDAFPVSLPVAVEPHPPAGHHDDPDIRRFVIVDQSFGDVLHDPLLRR